MDNRIICENFSHGGGLHGEAPASDWLESLKAAAFQAPSEPGVYIMKDSDKKIVYVGKAKSIKTRLKSYFSGGKDIKTATLLRRARSIETIIVSSEYEALLLENTLIKQHSPKYNISLKDGKTYPVIRITAEEFPRVFRTRRIADDKSLYFGPFPNAGGLDAMLKLVLKLFPLRKCRVLRKKGPCVYYHIGRCAAPCCGKISAPDYAVHVRRVAKLLGGETGSLVIDLTQKMHEAAMALEFEKAAVLRNTIRAIEKLGQEESSVVDNDPESRDYIAWAAQGVLASFTVFSMRGGKMTAQDLFRTCTAAGERESLELFLTSYYDARRPPPAKIFFQPLAAPDAPSGGAAPALDFSVLGGWFMEKFNFSPLLEAALEKRHAVVAAMARQNAAEDLHKRLKERGAGPALDELARFLNIGTRPERIEGFDISHLDGKHPVASLVSFKNGAPDRKNYRRFKLRSVVGKIDDFAAMREVVRRRYSRLIREGGDLPDLVLVDGGAGQANAAKSVLADLGLDTAVAGLAKRNEEVWLPEAKNPIVIPRQSEALKVLQFVRDESHRFAAGHNRLLRSKDLFFPILEGAGGIGAKRAAAIMKAYQSLENIAAADPAAMAKKCKITPAAAREVRAAAKRRLESGPAALAEEAALWGP